MKLKTFEKKLSENLLENETILWIGEPKPTFTISLWNGINASFSVEYPTPINSGSNMFGGLLLLLTILTFLSGAWLVGFILLFILLFPDLIRLLRRRYTKYAITNKRFVFQLWWWGFSSFNSIPLKRIIKLQKDEVLKNCGSITLFMNGEHEFWTRDFVTSEMSVYPTFEMIQNLDEVYNKISRILKT